jgi:hypothetical protein
MSNPPRRARPKKPAQTIDLEATALPVVGYAGPVSATPEIRDPETQATDFASEAGASAIAAGPSAGFEAAAWHDGTGPATDKSAAESFAEEESLRGEPRRTEFDETILAAAEPDFVNHADGTEPPAGPPPPFASCSEEVVV